MEGNLLSLPLVMKMDRQVIDLGIERNDEVQGIYKWKYLYVGDCDGDVTIKIDSRSASALNPEEFDKLTDVRKANYIYITNAAQAGKKLAIYFEEKMGWLW